MRARTRGWLGASLLTGSLLLGITGATPGAAAGGGGGVAAERAGRAHLIDSDGVPMPRGLRRTRVDAMAPDRAYRKPSQTANMTRAARRALDGARPRGVSPAGAAVSTSYAGMNQVSAASSPFGWRYPPDTILARSSARNLQMVNRRVRLTSTAGGTVYGTRDLNRFFGAVDASGNPTGPLLFDPKAYYDRNATNPRFIAVALQASVPDTPRFSRLYIAISRSPNPSSLASGSWCRYWLNTRFVAGLDTWADYPGLGVGRDAIVVSTNQFNWAGDPAIARGVIRAWAKNAWMNNATSCPAGPTTRTWTTRNGNPLPTTLQPAQHYTSPSSATGVTNPVYLVNTYTNTANYGIWRIANIAGSNPLLWGPVQLAGSVTNTAPPNAPNGGGGFIATGDARTLQVAARGNQLHSVNATSCNFTVSTPAESCLRYLRFNVSFGTNGALAAAISQQVFQGGGDGWYYFYPSVAVNAAGSAIVAADAVGPSTFFGSVWGFKTAAQTGFAYTWLAQGTCALTATYDNRPSWLINRAGDYTGAAADPDGVRLWVSAERAVNITNVGCGWQTYVQAITP